jgi:hypothetical protein
VSASLSVFCVHTHLRAQSKKQLEKRILSVAEHLAAKHLEAPYVAWAVCGGVIRGGCGDGSAAEETWHGGRVRVSPASRGRQRRGALKRGAARRWCGKQHCGSKAQH